MPVPGLFVAVMGILGLAAIAAGLFVMLRAPVRSACVACLWSLPFSQPMCVPQPKKEKVDDEAPNSNDEGDAGGDQQQGAVIACSMVPPVVEHTCGHRGCRPSCQQVGVHAEEEIGPAVALLAWTLAPALAGVPEPELVPGLELAQMLELVVARMVRMLSLLLPRTWTQVRGGQRTLLVWVCGVVWPWVWLAWVP